VASSSGREQHEEDEGDEHDEAKQHERESQQCSLSIDIHAANTGSHDASARGRSGT
jgi:hypothetical protein